MYTIFKKLSFASSELTGHANIELLISTIDFRMFAYEVTPGAYLNTKAVFKVQTGRWFTFTFVLQKLFSKGEKCVSCMKTYSLWLNDKPVQKSEACRGQSRTSKAVIRYQQRFQPPPTHPDFLIADLFLSQGHLTHCRHSKERMYNREFLLCVVSGKMTYLQKSYQNDIGIPS